MRRRSGAALTEIEEGGLAIGKADKHEATSAEIAGRGMRNGESEGYGYGRVDGITTGLENGYTGIGSVRLASDNHGVQCANWLASVQIRGTKDQTEGD
jgi:hypothetical protein